MKYISIITMGLLFGTAALLMGQSATSTSGQTMGRGRGGAPYAWNDKNEDGICDLTGRPVGQGRAAGAMRAGRGGWAAGIGVGRGMGRGFRGQQRQNVAPPPQQ